MAGFGDKLRYKRMGMGLTIREASKKAKIKQKYLKALEEENVIIFRDKETVITLIKKYTPVLELDQEEIIADFNDLWTDARTAKAYLQQTYRKGNGLNLDKIPTYGAVVLAAALFLFVGGYLVWDYVVDPSSPVEETVPGVEADEAPLHDRNDEAIISAEKQEWDHREDDDTLPEEAGPGEKEYIKALEQEDEVDRESEKEEVAAEDKPEEEKTEEENEEDTYDFEEKGEPVPRTGSDPNLLYAGLYLIAGGLLLLLCLHRTTCSRMFNTKTNLLR